MEIFTLYVSTIIYAIIVWQYHEGKTQERWNHAIFVKFMRHVSAAIPPTGTGAIEGLALR